MSNPFHITGQDRSGGAIVLCDHASNHVPDFAGGCLGLPPEDMARQNPKLARKVEPGIKGKDGEAELAELHVVSSEVLVEPMQTLLETLHVAAVALVLNPLYKSYQYRDNVIVASADLTPNRGACAAE